MGDIFISYAKEDRSRVELLAKALEDQGWSVWWDPIIPIGKDFDEVIEEELSKARCVIVIWTKRSVKSKYVKGEAREALNREILVPIEIESGIKPPFDFRSIQTLSLINWDGSDNFPGYQKLIADILTILGEPPAEKQKRQRAEAERKAEKERKHKETEAQRRAGEEKQRKVRKELKRKAEEKERQIKEAEAKRKAEEEQKRRGAKAEIKPDKLEPDAIAASEPRKLKNVIKFSVLTGSAVLLIVGIMWYISDSKKFNINNDNDVGKTGPPIAQRVFKDGPSGGKGGTEFADNEIPLNSKVIEVRIHSDKYINAIQIIHKTSGGKRHPMTKHGGSGGKLEKFTLQSNEYITGISGKYGNIVDSIRIYTNIRESKKYGGSGGVQDYSHKAPEGAEVVGFFGRSGNKIDAIGVIVRKR